MCDEFEDIDAPDDEPAALRIERPPGAPRPVVHTELGVDITFDPSTGEFSAKIGGPGIGRGSAAEMHSTSFGRLLARIRRRALVVPVDAYLLEQRHVAGRLTVEVRPVKLVEYHKKREFPCVVQVVEQRRQLDRWQRPTGPLLNVRVKRAVKAVYLPTAEQVAVLGEVWSARDGLRRDYEQLKAKLDAEERRLMDLIKTIGPNDVRYVQQTGAQLAEPGLATFDLEDEDDIVDEGGVEVFATSEAAR